MPCRHNLFLLSMQTCLSAAVPPRVPPKPPGRKQGSKAAASTALAEGALDVSGPKRDMRLADAPGNVRITRRVSGLPHDSVVNVSQLITLGKRMLTEKVGRLPAQSLRDVEAGIKPTPAASFSAAMPCIGDLRLNCREVGPL